MPNKELKKARIDKEITQAEIAKRLDMNIATYNRKENGMREFTESEIKKVCEILDIDISEVFFLN